ncbi:MAG: ribosome biogenesis GTPase YlqF [Bacilli bacterium]
MAKDMYQKRKERKEKAMGKNNAEERFQKSVINWYPGHMAKAKRLMKERLPLIDIVFELIDSRIPYSSKINNIDETIGNKEKILVFNKYDLCDKTETDKWIEYYKEQGFYVVKTELIDGKNIKSLLDQTKEILKAIDDKRIAKGLKPRKKRAMIVGIPNVGKSTLINKLTKRKSVKTGNKPGVTKSLDWIRVGNDLELMDTPGILWPKLEDQTAALNLATFSAIKEEILPLSEVSVHILKMYNKYYPHILKEYYSIENFDKEDLLPVFETIAKFKNFKGKGNNLDFDKVVLLLINDIKDAKIKNLTFDRL